jgi:similar to stage IV sporulation protein
MFSLNLTRWLIGYVRFGVRGGSPERFYTACAKKGIYLWNIRAGQNMGACVAARKYRALRPLARRSGCRLKIREKHGLPFLLYKTHGHMGLWAGAAAFLIIAYILSLRVWCVEITGDSPYPAAQLEKALAAEGLSPGTWRSSIDPRALAQNIMLKFPEIRWMSINLHGCGAEVAVQKKVKKPEIADLESICNIKASATGQIISMKVYAGNPVVKKGDAVVKDQLLVDSVVEDQTGGSTLTHASAEIIAETTHNFSVRVDLKQKKTVFTGNKICRRNLDIFNARFPLSFQRKPGNGWNVSRAQYKISMFGIMLPLGVYEEEWSEVQVTETTLTKDEARARAKKEVEQKTKQILPSGKVISSKIDEKWENGALLENVFLVCEENIAQESPIFIKDS